MPVASASPTSPETGVRERRIFTKSKSSIERHDTGFGVFVNRKRSQQCNTLPAMGGSREKDVKKTLWENVSALMLAKYGRDNLKQLAHDSRVGVASVQRIKEMKTSVGIDIVSKIARSFRLDAYQLLCPNVEQEQFRTICEAYNIANETTRGLFVGFAEQIIDASKPSENLSGQADRT